MGRLIYKQATVLCKTTDEYLKIDTKLGKSLVWLQGLEAQKERNKMKKTIEEVNAYLIENRADEYGDVYLRGLKFEGHVFIDNMKVGGYLYQSEQTVKGNLYQHGNEVKGSLFQHRQTAQGNLHNHSNQYGEGLVETPSIQLLKEITPEELAEMGYKLKGDF